MAKLFANDFALDFRITEKTDGAFHRRARKGGGNKRSAVLGIIPRPRHLHFCLSRTRVSAPSKKEKSRCTLIFSPSNYQFKDAECYSGFEGVSLLMCPTSIEYKKFVDDLKREFEAAKSGKKNDDK